MTKSHDLYQLARHYIPAGVNSPVRAFRSVGGEPLFIKSAKGAYVFDEDDNKYIDYVGSWGPMILGHAHPDVIQAVKNTAENGLSFGAPTSLEIDIAKKITQLMPSIEMLRMVNSGTEATMSAIRLARGFTKRNKIIKFNGCYHGHSDSLLVKAGSGALTFGIPDSLGVPEELAQHTLVADFNDLDQVTKLFEQNSNDIAAIIVEPIAGNMNCVLPKAGFLQGLRQLCDHYQSVLIFDEVMTGFRVSLGGAQEKYNIKPDLTTLGKIIGGGMPVGAFGGKREIMENIAPLGGVYQAGTLSGNPVAMAAGLATLALLQQPGFYEQLEINTRLLLDGMRECAKAHNIDLFTQNSGSFFGFYFTNAQKIENLSDVQQCNIELFKKFFHQALSNGVYFAPSAYEAGFFSGAHTKEDIEFTLKIVEKAFASIAA